MVTWSYLQDYSSPFAPLPPPQPYTLLLSLEISTSPPLPLPQRGVHLLSAGYSFSLWKRFRCTPVLISNGKSPQDMTLPGLFSLSLCSHSFP